MAVELFIESPVGHKTAEWRFQPGASVRIAGHVTSVWSIPAFAETVDLSIRDGETQSIRTITNLVGNFWWDVALPTAEGNYTILATTSLFGNATLTIEITRSAVHTSFEVGVDPREPFVGGAVKVTARILADGIPVLGVSVVFFLRMPSGKTVSAANTTNDEGVTYVAWQISQVGQHWVEARAEAVGVQAWATFLAYSPDDPDHTPEPTPAPPDVDPPTPNGDGGLDFGSLLGAILPLMLLGLVMSMTGSMTEAK